MSKAKNKGEYFEGKTHEIVEKLNPESRVYKDIKLEGKLSKINRQVDVQVVSPGDYDFLVIECKDHTRPVDVKTIDSFSGMLRDIDAKKGAIVSNSSYTKAAQSEAAALGIELLQLVDTKDGRIRGKLYSGLIVSDIIIGRCALRVGGPSLRGPITTDLQSTVFVDDGKKITAKEVISRLWNDAVFVQKPGSYEYFVKDPNKIKLLNLSGEEEFLDRLSFIYDVIERHFYGKVRIIETQGIFNVKDGSYQTRSLQSEPINAYDFEMKAKELTQEEFERAKSTVSVRLECVSRLPETNGQISEG